MSPAVIWLILFQIVCLILFGCSSFKKISQAPPAGSQVEGSLILKDSDTESILEYYRHLHSLSEEELNREYTQAQQTLSEKKRSIDRIRLVLLLSLPHASFKDYDRSLTFLKDDLNDAGGQDSALKDFLFFLSAFIQELKNQDERYQKLEQKLKEEKKQREVLEQKLEELKAIEKNLLERDKKNSP
jgi:hypothetical protein